MQLTYKLIDWELCLSWDNYPTAHHYRLEAMTQTFIYSSIATTLENKYKFPTGEYGSYIRFKVVAESKDDTILFESNEIEEFTSMIFILSWNLLVFNYNYC